MFRVGIVKVRDAVTGQVRVTFPDRDQVQSYWLPVVFPKTQNDKAYWLPDVGEQVVCTMDEYDEDGAVLGAIYSSVDTTPVQNADKWHITMKDGTTMEYDRALHVLDLRLNDSAEVRYDAGAHSFLVSLPAGASATIEVASGPSIAFETSGDVNVNTPAKVNVTSGGDAEVSAGGSVNIEASSLIKLAGGGPAVARVGDATTCPAGAGTITSGSGKVQSG
jgi:phage baseplate assembly protein V